MKLSNKIIRKAISESGLKYWHVANQYGISDGNFSRLLRKELSNEKKERILKIINELKKEGEL